MRTRRRFEVATLVLATVIAMLVGGTARAGLLQVTFHETGFTDVTVIDNMAGDLNPAVNQILTLVPANFTDYAGSLSVSSNNPGNAALGSLSLNPTIGANTAGAAPLVITALQTGFTLPLAAGSSYKFTSALAVSGLSSGSVGLLSSIDSTSTPPQSLSSPGTDSQSLTYIRGATYELMTQSTINLTGAGDVTNFSATLTAVPFAPPTLPPPVPEPSTFALLSLGGLALAGWRRWKKRAAA